MTFRIPVGRSNLWETRGEQGHMLGSYMCDMCPAILQGSTCRNDKCEQMINGLVTWIKCSTPVGGSENSFSE